VFPKIRLGLDRLGGILDSLAGDLEAARAHRSKQSFGGSGAGVGVEGILLAASMAG